jgi:3-deoxy-manno-octulosonate cytidylyltransferase (CMP-KDO synthetase)
MKIAAIIPARYESTRLRGKPLATICRKPMLQWVYEAVQRCNLIDQIFIATDHAEIMQACRRFGASVCMTDPAHATGTDRVAEVARNLDARIIVNIQGDEPLLTPEAISEAITPLLEDETIPLGTLKTRIDDERDLNNANVVKVVTDAHDFALYFSRSPIPFIKDKNTAVPVFRHIGLYVFRKDFLLTFTRLPQTVLEKAESLEQLRALEHGYRIKVPTTSYKPIGVDTPEDLVRVENILMNKKTQRPQNNFL